jgi:hypothetical protein
VTRIGVCLLLACAGCARYEPRPLDPAAHPAAVLRRDLADAALVAEVTRHAGAPEANRWTDRQLAVAALRLRADLRRYRGSWRSAASLPWSSGASAARGSSSREPA